MRFIDRKKLKEEWIKKAREKFGDKFNYNKVEYENYAKKVWIICPNHGEFLQKPGEHLDSRYGCPKCAKEKAGKYRQQITTEEFIKKAREVHGDRYDYALSVFNGMHNPITIICRKHGSFQTQPSIHLKGHNCPKCGGHWKHTKESFIEASINKHGNKYDYSNVNYVNNHTLVRVICREISENGKMHGEFMVNPKSHMHLGIGCPLCSGRKKNYNTETFIEEAQKVHGDKYDYSLVKYEKSNNKVKIKCKDHGIFEQTPSSHLQGSGCPKCRGMNKTTKDFIEEAKKVHGDKYDYSQVNYENATTKVKIICKTHGVFWQTPNSHLRGVGCIDCAGKRQLDTDEFIKRARQVHGQTYDYSKTNYVNNHTKLTIICKKHGEWQTKPYVHLKGFKCPYCNGNTKKTTEDFIEEARQIHKDKYDYSRVDYKNANREVCIVCHKKDSNGVEHGEFWQRPINHLHGEGCGKCAIEENANRKRKTNTQFIKDAKVKHGDKYDYSLVDYKNALTKVAIICPKHGIFIQKPNVHLSGCGCPRCKYSKLENEIKKFLENNNITFEEQYKTEWLDKQSLDFYLPNYNVAIECQGIQHYKPIDFGWKDTVKTQKTFAKICELDRKKKEACDHNGTLLLYFTHEDEIEEGNNTFKTKENLLKFIKARKR